MKKGKEKEKEERAELKEIQHQPLKEPPGLGVEPSGSNGTLGKSATAGSKRNLLPKDEKKLKEESGPDVIKKAKNQANQAKKLREGVWNAAKEGTLFEFKDAIGNPKDPSVDVMERGEFGETLLHIACLFANFPVMKYIVENFPELTNETYLKEPYVGEAALHIAIVHADVDAVQFLLEHGADVNGVRCTGTFFRPPKGKVYLGEHPLTFAACVEREEKNKEMVRLLLHHGADFFNQDFQGNTLLHVLVIHNKVEMYTYIMDLFDLYRKPDDKRSLESVENKNGRTPLSLAAALGKADMFASIMRRRKEILWIYGPMAACAYPLDGLDTYQDSNTSSALELVVYLSGQSGNTEESDVQRADLLATTPVLELVEAKWDVFAKKIFYCWFLLYICYLVVFSIVIVQPDFLLQNTIVKHALEISVLCFATASVCLEFRDLLTLRRRYFTEKGSRFFYALAWINSCLIWLVFLFRMSHLHTEDAARTIVEAEEICAAIASISAWFYLLYFARGFKTFGFFVVSIREIIAKDITKFVVIYVIILLGFTLSFMVMFRRTSLYGFESFPMAIYSTFLMSLFAFDNFDIFAANNFAYTVITFIIFIFVGSLLLLNLLIAMMGDTYSAVRDTAEKQHKLEWVSIVLLLERRLPFFLRKKFRSGQPASDLGLTHSSFYLIVEEKTSWGQSAANRRLRFLFKNAIKKTINANRINRITSGAESKRDIELQKNREREEERRRQRELEEEEKKKSGIMGTILGELGDEFKETVNEMEMLRYQGDSTIGGALH